MQKLLRFLWINFLPMTGTDLTWMVFLSLLFSQLRTPLFLAPLPSSLEEVDRVVTDYDCNKRPRPDGLNFTFIKAFCNMMHLEMGTFFKELYCNAKLPRSFTFNFVALFPKVQCPFSLGDYRPISLLGCLYKILAKVLSSRLGSFMDSLISPVQPLLLKVEIWLMESLW